MKIKRMMLLLSLLLVSTNIFAQRDLLRYADIEFNLKRFEHAGSQYSKAFEAKKTYYSAKRAAQSFTFIKSYQKSFDWWTKVIEFPEADRSDFIEYARASILIGKELSTLAINLSEDEKTLVYGYVQVPINTGIEFKPLEQLNKSGSDYGLNSFKAGEYYFVSDRALEEKTEKKSIRLDVRKRFSDPEIYQLNERGYHAIFKNSSGLISPVKVDLEGIYHLGMPSFYKQGLNQEVIFTAVLRQKSKSKAKIETYPGLFQAFVQEDGSFTDVKALPFNKPTEFSVMHGLIYQNKLYFSSNMPGGYGGFDLYFSELKDGEFGPAINLGAGINSPADEVFPFIHDGEIYFSSNRAESLGGLDIYVSSLISKTQVKNMGIPYNSAQDDFAYFLDQSGVIYISSDRGKAESRDDIYSLSYLFDTYKFKIINEKGLELNRENDFTFKLQSKDAKDISSSLKDGKITALTPGDYSLEIRKKGYFPIKKTISVDSPKGQEKVVTVQLIPIPYKKLIIIDTIYYHLDRYNIRPDAAVVLDKTNQLISEFKDFGLNITSHTDTRASSEYNIELSKKRSRSASNYLINKGVSPDKISLDWRGKSELVNHCSDGVECPELLHEKNRRSIIRLELYPDPNQDYNLPSGINSVEELEEYLKKRITELKVKSKLAISPQSNSNNSDY